MPRRRVVAGPIAALAVLSSILVGCSSDHDSFYDTPSGLVEGEAGRLLREDSMKQLPAGTVGWRILYQSTGGDGRPIAVSGMFVRPDADPPPGGYPLISYAHPTTGVADACAPSAARDLGFLVEPATLSGFAVVITDYEGLGTEGIHPYLVGQSEGRSVLDAARAVRSLDDAGVSDAVGIVGYSQGGHAAMFAAQIAPSYAPDLRVIGAVSVSGPASDHWMVDMLETPALYALGVMAVVGWSATYPGLRPEDVLGPVGLGGMGRLTGTDVHRPSVCSDLGGIGNGHSVGELLVANPQSLPPWQQALAANAVGAARPAAPLLLFSGGADNVVAPSEARYALDRFCQAGATAERREIAGASHVTILDTAKGDSLQWLRDRLDGATPNSSCR